jgi:hypothetical protein
LFRYFPSFLTLLLHLLTRMYLPFRCFPMYLKDRFVH